ncbi:helix-turn-helix domain-containing protein [Hymenobacter wooponensis]|uniref:AraC family transcriptional regulator n=1 Tax=Hymenobacter wooponensis TaxID=1525360 RepID=A0A4Z0MTW5_9BACT|nr:helix-turn-helix transcriptional regulator [Hymenobacter wooponensis]TGD82555.1 AraC family transcriptional regulator [Hymenobacter wooponensis]
MAPRETITEYYQRYGRGRPAAGQVTAYRIEDVATPVSFPHIRRDFYKIKLLDNAQGILSYADRRVEVQAAALVFVNPLIPYSWERTAGRETGYACLFTEEFITQQLKTASVANSPLFRVGGTPVLFPPPEIVGRLNGLFEELLLEMQSSYVHKHDLLRNYVQLILHEALKLAPEVQLYQPGTSAARLCALFLDLLERQFPLASPQHPVALKNANEFARQLAVHTNHLNKALKEQTGKTTSAHIAEKLVTESKSLLRHSNWSLAEISYCLGFEHTSNFNAFFKKQTGQPPHAYRKQPVLIS